MRLNILSEKFVKDFALDCAVNRLQADDPPNKPVRNPLNRVDRMVEISAASCTKNSVEVRYPPMSSMASTLQPKPPCQAGMPVAPTTSPQLYCSARKGQVKTPKRRNAA